jgi:murein peptide amidase A
LSLRRSERSELIARLIRLIGVNLILLLVAAGTSAGALDPTGRRAVVLGRSVDGRPIVAVETGDFDAARRTLVVGCIHGNEQAGIAVAEWLAHAPPPNELDLWIIPVLNPDGVAADTRQNAHHVDLNRNFPWRWQPLGGVFNSGPRPLSEPESRIAYRLILRLHPQVSVWFHQHLDVVDESGGNVLVERRFAELTGLPLARLTREPGSAVEWENHRVPSGTGFVVELPAGTLDEPSVKRFAHAIVAVSEQAG